MKTIEQIAAEILVKSGYAKEIDSLGEYVVVPDGGDDEWIQETNPFADTLEGRRQADAIEDWLSNEHSFMWYKKSESSDAVDTELEQPEHQWRLDRIKWCLEQLRNEE